MAHMLRDRNTLSVYVAGLSREEKEAIYHRLSYGNVQCRSQYL